MSKYLEERVKDLEDKVERLQQQMNEVYKPKLKSPLDTPNIGWPQQVVQPDWGKQIGDNVDQGSSETPPRPFMNFEWTAPALTKEMIDKWEEK